MLYVSTRKANEDHDANPLLVEGLKECNPEWYKVNGDRMPAWREDLRAYEGWPTENYVPADTGEPEGTGPPIPKCYRDRNRPQGFPRQQGGRPQGNSPLGFPRQQGGRPQGNNPLGWLQGGRPQNNGRDDD
jgi:hypothetical protein